MATLIEMLTPAERDKLNPDWRRGGAPYTAKDAQRFNNAPITPTQLVQAARSLMGAGGRGQ